MFQFSSFCGRFSGFFLKGNAVPLCLSMGLLFSSLLVGCGLSHSVSSQPALHLQGYAHGGQQPVSGATVQMYAVGTSGDGSASVPLLSTPVYTDASGSFEINQTLKCPTASSQVYIAAVGGNPGLAGSVNNQSSALIALMGTCGDITSSSYVSINELTTLAAVSPLAPFTKSVTQIGSATSDVQSLDAAITMANELANFATGDIPGPALPQGQTAPVQKIATLGDILAACVNSAGGTIGDGSPCGQLYTESEGTDGVIPANTVDAALEIAKNTTHNVLAIYDLCPPKGAFEPTLPQVPANWSLLMGASVATPTLSPAPGTYAVTQSVTLQDTTSGAQLYYTTDGSTPSAASTPYSGEISVSATRTINAIAIANSVSSTTATGTYTITPTGTQLAFIEQPTSATTGTTWNPAPEVAIEGLTGSINTGATNPISLQITDTTTGKVISGSTTATPVNGVVSFAGLSEPTAGTYTLTATATGMTPVTSAPITVTAVSPPVATAPAISLTIPNATVEPGTTITGTINLTVPSTTALTVTLTSSATGYIGVLPSSLTIPVGATSASFTYTGIAPGKAQVTASATGYATTPATVASALSAQYQSPITITAGGTYTGNWLSTNPSVPAVTINTDQPVTLLNSRIAAPGTLIWANIGGAAGVHLTVSNVVGVATNANVAGVPKGDFLVVTGGTSIDVDHSTMIGVSHGISIVLSTLTSLTLHNNVAINVDDRPSDGAGGFQPTRSQYGHTIILADDVAPQGADISWNQFINQPGISSVEDVISIYESQGGSTAAPIAVHDNYIQGPSTTPGYGYSGGGIITDGQGSSAGPVSGFVTMSTNQVVQTENYGLAIAAGHDVSITNNRVVSCGKNAAGAWLEIPGFGTPTAYYLWNTYNSATFYNDSVTANGGGLIAPDGTGNPFRSDLQIVSASTANNDYVSGNNLLTPLTSTAVPTQADEQAEWTSWLSKLASAAQTVGASSAVQP